MVARSHGVNANQVFNWRKLYSKGLLNAKLASTQLTPVRIAEVVNEEQKPRQHHSGTIQIEVGQVRVRVEGSVDPDSLRLIPEHLRR